jgi:hypothetical protein
MVSGAEASIKAASFDIDRGASFGVQRTQRARRAGPHVLAGLGHLGLHETDAARRELTEALRNDPANLPARSALRELDGSRKEATVKP